MLYVNYISKKKEGNGLKEMESKDKRSQLSFIIHFLIAKNTWIPDKAPEHMSIL